MKAALRGALPALTFLFQRAAARSDLRSPQGKSQALSSLLGFVVDVEDRVERSEWIGRIAETLDVRQDLVEQAFADLVDQRRQRQPRVAEPGTATVLKRLDTVPLSERDLLRAVLQHPEWLAALSQTYGDAELRDKRVEQLLAAVAQLNAEGGGAGPVDAAALLDRCEAPGADALLSRLLVEEAAEIDWDYARGCALGVRRDGLRRQLQQVQRDIEESVKRGDGETDLAALERRSWRSRRCCAPNSRSGAALHRRALQ